MSTSPEAAAYDRWADYYDLVRTDYAPFIAFYGSLVDARTGSVLELGCGTGTIAIALARRLEALREGQAPARVVGVDGSEGMLRVARSRDAGIEWPLGDIREPPVEGRFDLVYCCFNTLQHLLLDSDLLQAFRAARDLLAPGGSYAFDLYQPNPAWLGAAKQDRLARSITDSAGRHLEIREDMAYDPVGRVVDLDWRLVDRDAPGTEPLAGTSYRMRQHFADDVLRLVDEAGLSVRARYGDFDRSPFDADSKKQILVCSRA